MQVAEANLHIGTLQAMLDTEGVSEISLSDDEEHTFNIIPATLSCNSSDNESDHSDKSMYSFFYPLSCWHLTSIAHQATALTKASLKALSNVQALSFHSSENRQ